MVAAADLEFDHHRTVRADRDRSGLTDIAPTAGALQVDTRRARRLVRFRS